MIFSAKLRTKNVSQCSFTKTRNNTAAKFSVQYEADHFQLTVCVLPVASPALASLKFPHCTIG